MAYVWTVKTASGARAVQIVHSSRKGSRDIEHIGSAHDDVELELLKAVSRQRLAAGQGELDLGLDAPPRTGGPLPITASRMGHLWDALGSVYDALGFADAADGDEVFRQLVLARIIEPTSKLDSLRVLTEAGIAPVSYRTLKRRLPAYAADAWRERLAALCAHHVSLGAATLLLYDVTTLYFETDAGDGFRESGSSKERRLEPQVTVGLLTDAAGFSLMVNAFEGNKAQTTTMLPVIKAFMAAHRLKDVVIVADAGMFSENNMTAIEAAGLSFILGMKIPRSPTSSRSGARPTRTPRSPTDRCSSSRGQPGRRINARTKCGTTSTSMIEPGARSRALTSRSARPSRPSPARPRSNATGSSSSPAPPRPSIANWRPRPARWPGSRATSRISPIPRPSRSSAPTTSCSKSKRASGWPKQTWPPARSTTAPETRSRRT